VAAGVILLVTLSLAGVLLAATRVVTRSAVARASADLETARSAFYRLVGNRADFAAAQTRLITVLPVFRATMSTGDVATLSQVADTYRQDLNAQFCLVTNPTGRPMATPGWPGTLDPPPGLQATIHGAVAGESRRDIVPIQGRLFQVTSEPAMFGEVELLGTITFGFPLDDRVAQELAKVTHAEINLVSAAGNKLVGSSLPPQDQREVAAALDGGYLRSLRGISTDVRTLGSRQFIAGTFSLFPDHSSDEVGHLVLLQDWAPTQQFLTELRRSLLLTGLAVFFLALGGGIIFSRRTSQPLIDMAAAAGDIAAGDWHRQVRVRGSAEATTMAMAFNDMTASLRDQAESLTASAQRFSTVTQSARDAIVSTDEAGKITFWNRSAETIFGYAEGEILGKPLSLLVAEADRASYMAALPVPASDHPTFGHTIEVPGIRKDGTTFPSEFSLAAVRGPQGSTLTAVIRDVTERKQVQDALRQRDAQFQQAQKMEAIGQLAGGVAHDFNNLLTVILGYCELLLTDATADDSRRDDLQEIQKAGTSAASLTAQLLAFSRKQLIEPRVLDLNAVVAEMSRMLQRLVGDDIEVVLHLAEDLGSVRADPGQLHQVLMNLVVNARDAMPSGGQLTIETVHVDLDHTDAGGHLAVVPGAYVVLAVSDTGTGMTPEVQTRLFEPFFTTKDPGKGTGLGLASVYGIVKQSEGSIGVYSEIGRGTTFKIYFPRIADPAERMTPTQAATRSPATETILVVEDNPALQALTARILRRHGYVVLLAGSPVEALHVCDSHAGPIQLLLTDVVMPGQSGPSLAAHLTADRVGMRVLYMSGYAAEAIARRSALCSTAAFLQKPFSPDALLRKVQGVLATIPE
jgi:PAS domain S-box-containing protein